MYQSVSICIESVSRSLIRPDTVSARISPYQSDTELIRTEIV